MDNLLTKPVSGLKCVFLSLKEYMEWLPENQEATIHSVAVSERGVLVHYTDYPESGVILA